MVVLDRRSAIVAGLASVAGFGSPCDLRADEPAVSFCPCVDPIDRYVAWTDGWRGRAADPALWAPLCDWVAGLTAATRQPIPTPFQDPDDLLRAALDPAVVTRSAFTVPTLTPTALACRSAVAIAPEIVIPYPLRYPSVLVSRGRVRARTCATAWSSPTAA